MSTTTYRRRDGVAVVDPEPLEGDETPGRVFLARMPEGPLVVLEGTSAAIWRAVVDPAGEPPTISEVALRVGQDLGLRPEDIQHDVGRFLADLADGGFLEATPSTH